MDRRDNYGCLILNSILKRKDYILEVVQMCSGADNVAYPQLNGLTYLLHYS